MLEKLALEGLMHVKVTVEVKVLLFIMYFMYIFIHCCVFHFEGPLTLVHNRKVKLLGVISFGAGK